MRPLLCNRCGAEWKAASDKPSGPTCCPYCNTHVCGCGCGADLSAKRTDARYEAESHAKRLQRAANTDIAPLKTVADARVLHEDAKAHWSMVADEGIARYFRAHPDRPLHADDLADLGIPDEHRNIIGSQIAKWVNRDRMVECGRRKSIVPSRNGAKSNEYRLTKVGVKVIAGLGAGTLRSSLLPPGGSREQEEAGRSPAASVEPGEIRPNQPVSGAGVPKPQGPGGAHSSPDCASTASPDSLADELEQAEGQLFERDPVPVATNSAFSPDNPYA